MWLPCDCDYVVRALREAGGVDAVGVDVVTVDEDVKHPVDVTDVVDGRVEEATRERRRERGEEGFWCIR